MNLSTKSRRLGPWRRLSVALVTAVGLSVLTLPAVGPAAAATNGGTITSAGPLTEITTSLDLNCAVRHVDDSSPEFFGTTACGTFVAAGGVLYGPADVPAGGGAGPRTSWTSVGQVSSGAGTAVDPYRIVTVVRGGPLLVTQTDTYVVGSESYGTRIAVENTGATDLTTTVYRAGDCFLQNSDRGYGRSDTTAGSVACVAGESADSRILQWAPLTPGSQFYEASFGSVWSAIGSQQPFPNTSEDGTLQDNGAGLSWVSVVTSGSTATVAHLTAFSPDGSTQVSDRDGDSFPDNWEEPGGGVDTDGDGAPDLMLADFGADPDRPDVFVQVNWIQTRDCGVVLRWRCSANVRQPSLAALGDVQQAFWQHGINLHLDAGPTSIMDFATRATWGTRSEVSGGIDSSAHLEGASGDSFNWTAQYDGIRDAAVSDARARIFHHALYVGEFNAGFMNSGSSGISRISDVGFPSRDFLIAYDSLAALAPDDGDRPTRLGEAGTFMHELGHNLGLSHGGSAVDSGVNRKPNYPSLMNYLWQTSGVPRVSNTGLLDYSSGSLDRVDENALDERAGLDPDTAAANFSTRWSCPGGWRQFFVDYQTNTRPSVRDVDWDCDGSIDTSPVRADLNDDVNQAGPHTYSELSDFHDWSALVFDGGGAIGGAGDSAAVPATTQAVEPSVEELAETAGDNLSVQLVQPGELVMQAGTTSPVEVQVTNRRNQQVSYELAGLTQGVELTDVPALLDLDAGETRTVTLALTAGSPSDAAFYEITARSVDGDETNTAGAVTAVYVVPEVVPDQPGTIDVASVEVRPAGNTVIAGTPVAVAVTARDGAGRVIDLPAGVSISLSRDGRCPSATCTPTSAGVQDVSVLDPSGTPYVQASLVNLTVTPAAPAALAATSGRAQSAPVGTTFTSPFVVTVTDRFGNPVSRTSVTFTATGSTFASPAAVLTDATGRATSSSLRAGSRPAAASVTARAAGLPAVTFDVSVTPAPRPVLTLQLSGPAQLRPGASATITATLTNSGTGASRRTATVLSVPAGVQVLSASGGTAVGSNTAIFTGGALAPGASTAVTLTIRVRPGTTGTIRIGGIALSTNGIAPIATGAAYQALVR